MPEETIMHDGMTISHEGNIAFNHLIGFDSFNNDQLFDELTERFLIELPVDEKVVIQIAEERVMAVYDETILFSVTILGKQTIRVTNNNDEGKFVYDAKIRLGKEGDAEYPYSGMFHSEEYRLRWRYKRFPEGAGYSEWSDVFVRTCDKHDEPFGPPLPPAG
jgi:hypothetical protein